MSRPIEPVDTARYSSSPDTVPVIHCSALFCICRARWIVGTMPGNEEVGDDGFGILTIIFLTGIFGFQVF